MDPLNEEFRYMLLDEEGIADTSGPPQGHQAHENVSDDEDSDCCECEDGDNESAEGSEPDEDQEANVNVGPHRDSQNNASTSPQAVGDEPKPNHRSDRPMAFPRNTFLVRESDFAMSKEERLYLTPVPLSLRLKNGPHKIERHPNIPEVFAKIVGKNVKDGIPVWRVDGRSLIELYKRTQPDSFTTFTKTNMYDGWNALKSTGLHPIELIEASASQKQVTLKLEQKWIDKMRQYDSDHGVGANRPVLPMEHFARLVREATSVDDRSIRLAAVRTARLLTSQEDPPIEALFTAGMLPVLIDCLKCHDEPSLQIQAAWAVTNFAAGASFHTQRVVDAGAVPLLIDLLRTPQQAEDLIEQTVWALANIIGDGPQSRDLCISLGVVQPLLALVRPAASLQLLRDVAWGIPNLCQSDVSLPPGETVAQVLPAVAGLVRHADLEVIVEELWAFAFLVDDGENYTGVVPILVSFLGHTEPKVQGPALRSVGGILLGTYAQTQAVMSSGALAHMPALLGHPRYGIREDAIWCLSNLLVHGELVQQVIDADLIPQMVHLLYDGQLRVQKEAAWAAGNLIVSGTNDQIAVLVACGALPPFFALLFRVDDDAQFVNMVSEDLRKVLHLTCATPADRLVTLTGERGARPLKDLCLDSVLSSVRHSVSSVNQLPLPTVLIDQLKDALENPSFYVRAKNFIEANMKD